VRVEPVVWAVVGDEGWVVVVVGHQVVVVVVGHQVVVDDEASHPLVVVLLGQTPALLGGRMDEGLEGGGDGVGAEEGGDVEAAGGHGGKRQDAFLTVLSTRHV